MDIDKQTRWADDGFGDVMDAANEETIALVMGSRHLKAHKTRLIAAVPEMLELLTDLSQAYDDSQSGHELASRLYDLRCVALRLLAKIKGGGE